MNKKNTNALELILPIISDALRGTTWDTPVTENKLERIMNKQVSELTGDDISTLIMSEVHNYNQNNKSRLDEFSDEDIINEVNRRIQNGTIDSTTRFHVSKRGVTN